MHSLHLRKRLFGNVTSQLTDWLEFSGAIGSRSLRYRSCRRPSTVHSRHNDALRKAMWGLCEGVETAPHGSPARPVSGRQAGTPLL